MPDTQAGGEHSLSTTLTHRLGKAYTGSRLHQLLSLWVVEVLSLYITEVSVEHMDQHTVYVLKGMLNLQGAKGSTGAGPDLPDVNVAAVLPGDQDPPQ